MKNIKNELDEILVRKVITRHFLPFDVEARLDKLFYFPLRTTIISNIKSLLTFQTDETDSTEST